MTALVTVRCNKIFMSSESIFSTQRCKRYQRGLVSPDTARLATDVSAVLRGTGVPVKAQAAAPWRGGNSVGP